MKSHPDRLAQSTLAITVMLALGVACAHAHPGHGVSEASALHILSSPYHLAVLALTGSALLLAGRFVQRRLPRRALQVAGIAALTASTVLWGLYS